MASKFLRHPVFTMPIAAQPRAGVVKSIGVKPPTVISAQQALGELLEHLQPHSVIIKMPAQGEPYGFAAGSLAAQHLRGWIVVHEERVRAIVTSVDAARQWAGHIGSPVMRFSTRVRLSSSSVTAAAGLPAVSQNLSRVYVYIVPRRFDLALPQHVREYRGARAPTIGVLTQIIRQLEEHHEPREKV